MTKEDGVVSVVNSGKETEWEWKINNFSRNQFSYRSPNFKFEGESWSLSLFHNYIDKYMQLSLAKTSPNVSPIKVEFSVSVKTTEGKKKFERRERCCCEGKTYDCAITRWITISELSNPQSDFLSSGCLTIILTMKTMDSEGSNCASTFLSKLMKCVYNWFDYECHTSNAKAASDAAICSCCKENIDGHKISFHKDCLGKASKCAKCDEDVSWPNWFDHVCEMQNALGESSTAQTSGSRHKDKTLQDLKKLFLNQENFDVVLRVQGQEFSAHQAILTARSPVFASTFRSNMMEKETGRVDIDDIDPSCFSEFLCFLYCGEVDKLSTENVRSLFSAADKYQIMDLRTMCLEFMKDNVTVETFCDTLVLALLHTETELIDACTDYFVRNAEEILVTVKWQTFAAENPVQSTELFIKHVKHVK